MLTRVMVTLTLTLTLNARQVTWLYFILLLKFPLFPRADWEGSQ